MHGQIANFCPVISRNSIVKNPSSVQYIWQAIRMHYGFQSTGAHFLNFSNFKLEHDECPEILYHATFDVQHRRQTSHSLWTCYTPWRSCCPRRRKMSYFWEYDCTYMVKAGRPRPFESSQTEICHWIEISLIDLDKVSALSGLTVIVGRALHSRWLKRIVGYHRKVQTTQPTNSVQVHHPTNNNQELSQVMPLPYKSKVHIQHRRRRTWQHRIEPFRRRWSWPTHTRIFLDCFAPYQHQV